MGPGLGLLRPNKQEIKNDEYQYQRQERDEAKAAAANTLRVSR